MTIPVKSASAPGAPGRAPTTRDAAMTKIRRLYNYQPFKADWLSKVLSDDVIHCTNPENFNDPWDCRPCF